MRLRMLAVVAVLSFSAAAATGDTSMTTTGVLRSALVADAVATIDSLCSAPRYRHAMIGIAVVDARTSEVIYERNSEISLLPASCLKAITTAFALRQLGPEHRFETRLEAIGEVADGVLTGSLVIRGGGDPTLGSDKVDGSLSSGTLLSQWVEAVQRAGIREISGGVQGDPSYLPDDPLPSGWMWEDIGNYYAAGTSGLAFYDNLYHLYFRPGARVGDPAKIVRTEPPIPQIRWTNRMLTGPADSGDQGYIYGQPGSWERTTRGTVPLGPEFSIKGSVPSPHVVAADALRNALETSGIRVRSPRRHGRTLPVTSGESRLLAVTVSPPLSKIVHRLNKESNNFYAEMLLLHAGKSAGAQDRKSAIEAEMKYLESLGVPTGGLRINDGSGLSRLNFVTAAGMARFMQAVQREPWFDIWLASLPHMGVDADLKERHADTPLKGRVRAKTGLIERVRGLTGYLDAKSGARICFAIILNGYDDSWVAVDGDVDVMLRALHDAL
ncbi:MAG: D-alanyl-D-alanine carboxypeptidase/D-alanyl-D-alanine-endopeptidase [Candidatus Sumerlaeaceae bacterium]|nr:D-alanyl-D-alanine carboxypeptidase/D-alanyl-D-alanine-endopeptidase [Candidatus Sumerlaeaceae bacterium]